MEPYGALMEPYGALWSLIEPYGALSSLIKPLIVPYGALWSSDGAFWSPDGAFWSPYGAFWSLLGSQDPWVPNWKGKPKKKQFYHQAPLLSNENKAFLTKIRP